MASINDSISSLVSQLGLGESATETKKSDTLGQSDFLELMITQLKSQDPFAPMENGDFIAQMAQFSSVSGLAELQQSFQSLATSLKSNQALQASSLVGRSVMVSSAVGTLPQEGAMSGLIDMPFSSGNVTLTVQDAVGQVIRRLELGPQAAGDVYFNWDGRSDAGNPANPGRYYINASTNYDGETIALETFVNSSVESVTLGNGGSSLTLNLTDGNLVSLSDVREIR